MSKINSVLSTLNKKKMSSNEINELKKYIESASYELVADFYGVDLDRQDQKEKKKLNQKIQKIINRKICQQFEVSHIKNLKWFDLIEVKMFVDDTTVHDLRIYL